MDTAINKNNSLITQKELQKKWLMQNLLTGKKRLLNDEWITIKLGDVFEIVKSYSISREGLTKSYKENLIYCIHYGDIHAFYETDFIDFSKQKSIPQILDEGYISNAKDYLKEGDVIMADASEDYEGVGEVVEVVNLENKIAVGGLHTIVLRANSEIIAKIFCGYFFSSETVRNALRKIATGTSVYSVTKSQIHNLSFIIPNSLREQSAIAQVLQEADKEIQLLKAKTEKLREMKKGLMQVLLTGKKRLQV
jgi:type I restriction enzyme S subunit